MKKHFFPLLFILVIVACNKSGSNTEQPVEQSTDEWNALTGGKPFSAKLSGAAEVPGPGDASGRGTFEMSLNPGKRILAYKLAVSDIGKATAAHIHEGVAGVSGPVRLTLDAPVNGNILDTLSELDRTLIQSIMKNPQNYYVNVQSERFPKGAVRGQISK
jgi:hypothetical protein